MDDITRLPGARSAQYEAAHPGTVICCVEGTWRAWLPASGCGGTEYCARTEDELLDRLPS